jgi:exopolysaccharide production protein ExoQ
MRTAPIIVADQSKSLPRASAVRRSHLLGDAAWIIFLFVAAGGLRILPIESPERYFWVLMDAIVVYLFIRQSHQFLEMLGKNKILASWGILAALSSLWSFDPGLSLYWGLQLVMTALAGCLLCLYADLKRIIQFVFLALLLTTLVSFAVCIAGIAGAFGDDGEWKGVFPHKNELGMTMTLFVITALCHAASQWPRIFSAGLSAGSAGLGVVLLILSRSGTALVSLVLCLAVFAFAITGRYGNRAFAAMTGLGVAAIAIGIFVAASGESDIAARTLQALGKESTLTGRTTLWDLGIEQFWRQPILGVGYRAFWESPQLRANVAAPMKGVLPNFHNNFLDVAVGLGTLGLAVFIAGILEVTIRVVRRFFNRPNFVNLWPVLFISHILVSCLVEAPIYANHGFFQILLVAAASARSSAKEV